MGVELLDMNKSKSYSLEDIAKFLQADFQGDPKKEIFGVAPLKRATGCELAFLSDVKLCSHLNATKAGVVITSKRIVLDLRIDNFILVDDPYLAYAKVSELFNDSPEAAAGIHPTVVIGHHCSIDPKVRIAAYSVIGNNVKLAAGVVIGAGCVISDGVTIGNDSKLEARVTIYHKVTIGEKVLIHSGAVIGADGFGNANDRGRWQKIYQLGGVVIGDWVEVGANTTIDRGALEDTVIGEGVKIDNQVQIAHNVTVGAHTAIAGCVGIAGSAKIGSYCMIGGHCGINGHIEIADQVIITGMTGISKSIRKAGVYSSAIPGVERMKWWRILACIMRLETVMRSLRKLEVSK